MASCLVRNTIREMLRPEEKGACCDRHCGSNRMDILIHNNLRCMYYGSFSQEMADRFVREHLLNPQEFWTRVPLPSIAAKDPCFENINFNHWGGQSQGLTYQRAIQALQNYGHLAEIRLLGERAGNTIYDNSRLKQLVPTFRQSIRFDQGIGPNGAQCVSYAFPAGGGSRV